MRNPFVAACITAAVFGLAFGAGVGFRNGHWWDSKLADWLDAFGSAGAAVAAVWLGWLALTKQYKNESGRASLVAFLIIREIESAAAHLREMDIISRESQFAWTMKVMNDVDIKRIAGEWKARRMNNTREHLYELVNFPGNLGRHVATVVPYVDHIAAVLARAAAAERDDRWSLVRPLLEQGTLDHEELAVTAAAVRALMEGRSAEAERMVAEIERLAARSLTRNIEAEQLAAANANA